jgi:uroporphyrinogen-III decarboxylase
LRAADYFDPKRYAARVQRSNQAWDEFLQGRRPHLAFMNCCAPFLCSLFGVDPLRYYTDLEVMADTQLKGIAWRLENLDEDEIPRAVFLDQGTVHEAVAFGLPIQYHPGSAPWGGSWIRDIHDVDSLPPPGFVRQAGLLETSRKMQQLSAIVEGLPVLASVHLHAPFTMAAQLFDVQGLSLACYDDPERVHRLLVFCVQAFLQFERVKWQYGLAAQPLDEFVCWRERQLGITRVWTSDDTASLMSPWIYEQFVLPYNLALYQHFEYVHLHMDGGWDHLLPYVQKIRPGYCEIGGETDWERAVASLGPSTILQGGVLAGTARDGSYGECAAAARQALDLARGKARVALTVANEVDPGAPLENLQAILEVAREREKV